MVATYSQKLNSPHWQRKRLEILNRADFTCENCGDKNKTLHVHHAWYEKGKQPWEYPNECYQCLCEDCHAQAESVRLEISKQLFSKLPNRLLEFRNSIENPAVNLYKKPQAPHRISSDPAHISNILADIFAQDHWWWNQKQEAVKT